MKYPFQEDSNFFVTLGKGNNFWLVLIVNLYLIFTWRPICWIFFKGAEWINAPGEIWRNLGNTIIMVVASLFYGAFFAFCLRNIGVFIVQEKEAGLKVAQEDKVKFPDLTETNLSIVSLLVTLITGIITYFQL